MIHKKSEINTNYGKKALKKGFCIFSRGKKILFSTILGKTVEKRILFSTLEVTTRGVLLTVSTVHSPQNRETWDQVCFSTRAQDISFLDTCSRILLSF
jgi:hypothetical protein